MKIKSIIAISAIATVLFACGPSEREKGKTAYEEQMAQQKKTEDEFNRKVDSLNILTREVITSATHIQDTIVQHRQGTVYVPDGELWEIKLRILEKGDSINPPIPCSCPDYKKNDGDVTSQYDAIINKRCIKFDGVFQVNEKGNGMQSNHIMQVLRPKYIPSNIDINVLENFKLIIGRSKIKDTYKMDVIKKLVETTKNTTNNQRLKEYYYTHCFNIDYSSTPLEFGRCQEIGD